MRTAPRRLASLMALLLAGALSSPLAMLAWLHTHSAARVVDSPDALPSLTEGCVMGARVYGPGEPSPVALQRVNAAAALAEAQPGLRFVVSGHEPANHEATEIATALVNRGVDPQRIRVDPHGVSTQANVMAMVGQGQGPVVFVSQGFHLPRTLWMARQQGLDAWGLRAERVAPTAPGASPLGTTIIRTRRHLREGVLALLHLVGVYETLAES